ncbi:MAG: penicillin-binding protein 2 [Dysgonamonadaceae bacterium]|jgi:penicillin-binding protein 2|nr:penicillin-binding protein 2 [Dysgonamonadaceae bacterium]
MKKNHFNPEERERNIIVFIGVVVLLYLVRLFVLQIVNDYKMIADGNAFLNKTIYPSRGEMYDRKGQLLVYNQATYDVMFVPREVEPFDTLDLCKILNITREEFYRRWREIKNPVKNPGYSTYTPQVFTTQLSNREYGIFQEKMYKFPGFYIQSRTVRDYKYPHAAHILGYIAEVDKKKILEEPYYARGDYFGKSGIESFYETYLRGEKGAEIQLRDAHGRIKGRYEDGRQDRKAVRGKNLKLSIDMDLQAYGELLMQNKKGAIVMIEPATGEVLCLVATPCYDPSIMIGRQFKESYSQLYSDPNKPLFNRAIQGTYPPGSTFKPAQALIYLHKGAIVPSSAFPCYHGYPVLGGRPGCHSHGSPLALVSAIATSCNAYFCFGLRALLDNRDKEVYPTIQDAFESWKEDIVSEGYGYRLGIDLPGESRGYIPNSKVYDKVFNRWSSSTIISIAIGQGEITATPLQIANLATTIANRGYFYTPHVVKEIEDELLDSTFRERRYTNIEKEYYEVVAEGMANAVTGGTCRGINLSDKGIIVCGKTGTAENPHGKDHSAFMGFAPKDDPRVAIAVYVENAGFGATYAVPIGRLMMEKYLLGEVPEQDKWIEDRMINTSILPYVTKEN